MEQQERMHDDQGGAMDTSEADRRSRDPRRIRTHEAIVRAGLELFAENIPEGVSIDELVRAAGVSKQSFYNHFSDRDDLARHILQLTRTEIDASVQEAYRDVADPALRVAVGICVYVRHALDHPQQAWIGVRLSSQAVAAESEFNPMLAEDVRTGLAKGRLACFTPETGIAFVVGVSVALLWRVLLDGGEGAALVVTPQFVTMLLRGFGLPPIEAETIASQAVERILRSRR